MIDLKHFHTVIRLDKSAKVKTTNINLISNHMLTAILEYSYL